MSFHDIYRGKRVLLTGHSGFKGSWLSFWLKQLGAKVCGVSLAPEFLEDHASKSFWCDINDRNSLQQIFRSFQPEIVFHLAAQALVRESYKDPVQTFQTNVMGTVNVLQCCGETPSVRAIVCVSSDKCYENQEIERPYAETDPLGGYDPYSASKGAMEIVISSWRRSFFSEGKILLASGRAGNVIGGGDMAADRLIPDLVRAYQAGRSESLRNPDAVRPWQHVLEPLSGYLLLGEKLLSGERFAARAWNFGPEKTESVTVKEAASLFAACMGGPQLVIEGTGNGPHEAGLLRLDCSQALRELHWHSVWDLKTAIRHTAEWYHARFIFGVDRMEDDFSDYLNSAKGKGLSWIQ